MTEKIELEDGMFEVFEARAKEKDFDDTGDYVRHVLQQVVEKIQREKQSQQEYSDEKAKEVKKKLSDLGYMD